MTDVGYQPVEKHSEELIVFWRSLLDVSINIDATFTKHDTEC